MALFTIVSSTNQTHSPLRSLFHFLSDFKNFAAILPDDKVVDFKHLENECSFNIKGITPMTVKLLEKHPYEYILFSSDGLKMFNFNLKVNFIGESVLPGQCRVELSGDLNPFIKAMAEKALTGLVDTMSVRLSELKIE